MGSKNRYISLRGTRATIYTYSGRIYTKPGLWQSPSGVSISLENQMNRQHDEIASSSAAESPATHSTRDHAVSLKTFDLHMKRNANNASCCKNRCIHQPTYRA